MIWPGYVLWGSGKMLMIYEWLNCSMYMNFKEFHLLTLLTERILQA